MSSPYKELKKLLAPKPAPVSGTVIAVVAPGSYKVQTANGVQSVGSTGNAAYKAGDEVLLNAGTIQGRIKDRASVGVYNA